MKNLVSTIVALAVLFVIPGCYWAPVSVAPSNTPLEGRTYTKLERRTGTDRKVRLFGIIPLSGNNRLEEAMKDAMKDGDALIDIVVEYHFNWFLFVTSHTDYVTATPIKFTQPVAKSSPNAAPHSETSTSKSSMTVTDPQASNAPAPKSGK